MTKSDINLVYTLIHLFLISLIFIYIGMIIPYLYKDKKKDSNFFFYFAIINIASSVGHLVIFNNYISSAVFIIIGIMLVMYGYFLKKKEKNIEQE